MSRVFFNVFVFFVIQHRFVDLKKLISDSSYFIFSYHKTVILNIFQEKVESMYRNIQDLLSQRRIRLNESKQYFDFMRDVEEVTNRINETAAIATSTDCGQDLEHVEVSNLFNHFLVSVLVDFYSIYLLVFFLLTLLALLAGHKIH